ncbi:hypothetical protein ACEQPO_01625 [Bacillus sp. SL00103]
MERVIPLRCRTHSRGGYGLCPRHGEVLDFDPLLEPTVASGMAAKR